MYEYESTLPPIQFMDPTAVQRRQAEEGRASSQMSSLAGKPPASHGENDGQIASLVMGALSKQPASAAGPAVPSAQREAAYNQEMSETSSATPTGEGLGPTYGKPQVYDPSEAILPPISPLGPVPPTPVSFTDPTSAERRTRDEEALQRQIASVNRNNGTLGHGEDDGMIGSVLMAAL